MPGLLKALQQGRRKICCLNKKVNTGRGGETIISMIEEVIIVILLRGSTIIKFVLIWNLEIKDIMIFV